MEKHQINWEFAIHVFVIIPFMIAYFLDLHDHYIGRKANEHKKNVDNWKKLKR
jgi:hypothetical protein